MAVESDAPLPPLSQEKHDRLQTIVESADAQLGQETIRDLMLSFLLPVSMVGVRTKLLLTREASARATSELPETVQRAYEAAMTTPGALWRDGISGENVLESMERTCALLSGLAMLLATTAEDARRGVPFKGMVSLPFLLTSPETSTGPRLTLIWDMWVLMLVDDRGGSEMLESGKGVDGLSRCVLSLLEIVRI
jgi:hypothetical protein